ncbi:MAG TPA: hypothetical protein EYH31_08220 [Anaerolineae bacterium]|nr:hypothetical protein [Anaerolineae bacterium]
MRKWNLETLFNQHWDTNDVDLACLPGYSICLKFTFRLAQSYLSKDDDAFYIIDNPVRKDKVFKTPMVSPTSWKGSLHHALWQLGHREGEQVKRLFGETRDDDTGQSGRLFFYPTFFEKTSLEIINPHDRVRRVGKNPILFESVPAGAKGRFTLLYVPFDRIGQDEAETCRQVAEDLTLLAQGLQAMFTLYGFGAKTSSGFGLAEDRVSEGHIRTNVLEEVQQATPPEEPTMPAVLHAFLEQFPDEDFSLKPNEWRKQHQATNSQRKQYMQARAARAKYKEALEAYMTELAAWESLAAEPVQRFVEAGFASFSELVEDAAKTSAEKLSLGGKG